MDGAHADAEIVRLLEQRRPRAMELLYDTYGALAYTLALQVTGDSQAAEDVVQDVFLSVWRRSETFDASKGRLRSWICAMIRNRAIDTFRRQRRTAEATIPLDDVAEPGGGDIWGEVLQHIEREQIHAALLNLPADQRVTLELGYFRGYSQAEISHALEIPLGTVKGRMRLGLEKLRGALDQTAGPVRES